MAGVQMAGVQSSLADLPSDIQDDILCRVCHEADLWALRRTCKRLRTAVEHRTWTKPVHLCWASVRGEEEEATVRERKDACTGGAGGDEVVEVQRSGQRAEEKAECKGERQDEERQGERHRLVCKGSSWKALHMFARTGGIQSVVLSLEPGPPPPHEPLHSLHSPAASLPSLAPSLTSLRLQPKASTSDASSCWQPLPQAVAFSPSPWASLRSFRRLRELHCLSHWLAACQPAAADGPPGRDNLATSTHNITTSSACDLSSLTALRTLALEGEPSPGVLSAAADLPHLQELSLIGMETVAFPRTEDAENLGRHLRALHLQQMQCRVDWPLLASLTHLTCLSLRNCSGPQWSDLAAAVPPSVRHLDIDADFMTGWSAPALPHEPLAGVTDLRIRSSGYVRMNLESFPSLRRLRFEGPVQDLTVKGSFADVPCLTELLMLQQQQAAAGPTHYVGPAMSGLRALSALKKLAFCRQMFPPPWDFKAIAGVEELHLPPVHYHDPALADLAALSNVRTLTCRGVPAHLLPNLCALPSLKVLDVTEMHLPSESVAADRDSLTETVTETETRVVWPRGTPTSLLSLVHRTAPSTPLLPTIHHPTAHHHHDHHHLPQRHEKSNAAAAAAAAAAVGSPTAAGAVLPHIAHSDQPMCSTMSRRWTLAAAMAHLKSLHLHGMDSFDPAAAALLPGLTTLVLEGITELPDLPMDGSGSSGDICHVGVWRRLQSVELRRAAVATVPLSWVMLPALWQLRCLGCESLEDLPEPPVNPADQAMACVLRIRELTVSDCPMLCRLPISWPCLRVVRLGGNVGVQSGKEGLPQTVGLETLVDGM